jgi:hypothetical protein
MKTKLICSAVSKEQLVKMIGDYFYSKEPFVLSNDSCIVMYPESSSRAGNALKGYRVLAKKGRYRFELIIEENQI